MEVMLSFVALVIIAIAIILHEVAHGYAAYLLGDPTAKDQGRLTLNPIPHIDLFGTLLIPAFLFIVQSPFLFGWAKPVPYNPYNLRGTYGEAIVAAAGPLTNIALALVFAGIYHLFAGVVAKELFVMGVGINIFLALLNLIPVPPLDGSKIVSVLLPVERRLWFEERVGSLMHQPLALIVLLLIIVFFLSQPLAVFVWFLTSLLLGVS